VDGLSLFIVPKYIRPSLTLEEAFAKGRVFHSPLEANDITIKRVHNIGKSACTYVDLEFGVESTLGAVAFLIGKENEGIKGIRHHLLSNNLQIAYNAISCGMSGYQHALSFASDPQPLDTLRHISYSRYQEIQEEVSPFPDDGHVYVTYQASLPYLEEQEKQRVEDFLNQQQQEAAEAEAEGLAAGYIADGKQVKRPLLARPDIKSLLLTQKAYLEGGLSLCVYATHLLDIVENDHNSEYVYPEIFQLFEFLSPIVKYYCTTFSLQSLHNAKQIFDGIGVVEGNVPQDILRSFPLLSPHPLPSCSSTPLFASITSFLLQRL
jgi:alkylation response protein AidB-like acyl-CoA dehydrogenase